MAADGYPMAPYVAFRDWHDPRSGLRAWAATPRFSQGYTAIQNRPGLLIETHMLKDYPTRVEGARRLVTPHPGLAERGGRGVARSGARRGRRPPPAPDFRAEPFPLDFELTDSSTHRRVRGGGLRDGHQRGDRRRVAPVHGRARDHGAGVFRRAGARR